MLDVKKLYKESGALLEGHFLLSSGNHSPYYLQSAKVLEDPKRAELLAKELAKKIKEQNLEVDLVCSPAIGGLIAGYELARALGVRFIFTERKEGEMVLRRGFEVKPNEKVIICEDIITTGKSAMEAGEEIEKKGGEIIAFVALANRGVCKNSPECKLPKDTPLIVLEEFNFPIYPPNECPLCKQGVPAIKPGSRGNYG